MANVLENKEKTITNELANKQMGFVMNAVKGLRQDLYQNDYCTGSAAYREVVRMLFIKMVLDKEVIENKITEKFHVMKRNNLREVLKEEKTMFGHENYTEQDILNDVFKEDILNLNGDSRYPKYSDLFRKNEEIVSSPEMIYKFIDKIENVNFIDLMEHGKDILGVVYEQFIYEVQNPKAGQIFTPTDVVEFMTDIAEISKDDVVLDFCSGSGRFLTSAMRKMIKDVDEKNEKLSQDKINEIKKDQVYGADIGSDPTFNSKRNMALAGDGSSNIANMNSLHISVEDLGENHIATFNNGKGVNEREIVGDKNYKFDIKNCSLILTNPPFGDLTLNARNYSKDWIDEMRETFNKASWSELMRWKSDFIELLNQANKYKDENIKNELEKLIDKAPIDRKKSVKRIIKKIHQDIENGESKNHEKMINKMFNKGKRTVTTKYVEKNEQDKLRGRKNFKGCLMFLYKAYQILEVGGRVLIVVDDGLLNTDTYAFARDFIRNKFYINAIISLSDKTFYAYSEKTIKTSILYLEKKEEIVNSEGDIFTKPQETPVFYAHAEKVGINSKRGKYENHLPKIKQGFFDFQQKINDNIKRNGKFDPDSFDFVENQIGGSFNE